MKFNFKIILLSLILSISFSCDTDEEMIILTGDSLAAGWDVGKFLPSRNIENRGVPGAVINDILNWNINAEGKTIILLIGTNNLPHHLNEDHLSEEFKASFIQSYLNVIHDLKAKKVIVISVLPRNSGKDPKSFNQEINKLNHELMNALSSVENSYFLNAFDYFLKDGNINFNYSYDGLHLNYYGYELLSKLLLKAL